MAQGRKTGGRTAGTPNKRTTELEAKAQATAEAIGAALGETFDGDAHALMMLIYKDPAQPMELRLEAAGKAIRFEKPALATIDMTTRGTVEHVISDEPLSPEERDAAWLAKHGIPTEH